MVNYKTVIVGVLLLLISSGVIYIQLQDKARIRIDADKGTFYVLNDNNRWIVSGREYNRLFDGSTLQYRDVSSITLDTNITHDNITIITRNTRYKNGALIVDTYTFDGNILDVTQFPLTHNIKIYNGEGLFYRYSIDDLTDAGIKRKLTGETSLEFGLNMKVDFDSGYRWAWVGYPYGSDSFAVQYDIDSDYEEFNVRLFDPPSSINTTLSGYTGDITAELGSNIEVYAEIDTGYTVCVDINHPDFGTNYSCSENSTTFNYSIDYFNDNQYEVENCYQGLANVSTSCGGLDTGTYTYGDYLNSSLVNPTYAYDGNYSTYTYQSVIGSVGVIAMNYTKPSNAIESSQVQFKTNTTFRNYTIPRACWLATGPLRLGVAIYNNYADSTGIQLVCSYSLGSITINSIADDISFYEASVTWVLGDDSLTLPVNTSINLTSHQYAEVINLTVDMVAIDDDGTYPSNVQIYINDTLSNDIGDVVGVLTEFEDSSSSINVTFTDEETQLIGHFKLPKTSDIFSASFNITGYNYTYTQETADNISTDSNVADNNRYFYSYYEKKNRTAVNWITRHGLSTSVRVNNTLNPTCINANDDWLLLSFYSTTDSSDTTMQGFCNGVAVTSLVTGNDIYIKNADSFTNGYTYLYDDNFDTYGCIGTSSVTQWVNKFVKNGITTTCESVNASSLYEEEMRWISYTRNPTIQIGLVDGVNEWNYTGLYSSEETIADYSDAIEDYLVDCDADENGYCNVPIYVYSDIGGILEISDINISYTVDIINPIQIDINVTQDFLDASDGEVIIPITFKSDTDGFFQISNLDYEYRGGNKSYTILAHDVNYTYNESKNVTYYYSDWTYSFPDNIDYLEFIPIEGPTQKNVIPYGQISTRPILNFTSQAYGGKTFNYSVLINETSSCVNDTISFTNNKSAGSQLSNASWVDYTTGVAYESTFDMYSWADFECTYNTWYLWEPYWYLRACCTDCDVCDESVVNVEEI